MTKRSITVSIPHHLTQDEARARLERGFTELRTKHAGKLADVKETWNGNHMDFQFKVLGQSITGRLDVEQQAVKVDVDLPFLIAMMAEKIRPQIEQEGRKM